MKTFLLPLFYLLLISPLAAQIINIPDANFKAALVADHVFVNTNGDNEIQLSEAQACLGFIVSGQKISDLTGIEYFINIKYIYTQDNSISTLDLSALPKLLELNCSNNQLTSLILADTLNDLQSFNTSYNQLTTLDLSALRPSIQNVQLQHNQLTDFTLTTSGVDTLDCSNNQLDSLWIADGSDIVFCDSNQLTFR